MYFPSSVCEMHDVYTDLAHSTYSSFQCISRPLYSAGLTSLNIPVSNEFPDIGILVTLLFHVFLFPMNFYVFLLDIVVLCILVFLLFPPPLFFFLVSSECEI